MELKTAGILVTATLAFVSCDTITRSINQPITTGTFDPLTRPGSGVSQEAAPSYDSELVPGSFVNAVIPNTAFYNEKPKGNAEADKLLKQGANMKIVSSDSDYVKVELDSGEVGWIPAVMVAAAIPSPDSMPTDITYPAYAPLPETGPVEPLPPLDLSGLPPEGAIPAIIDPDAPLILPPTAPIQLDPIPDLKPVEPKVEEDPKEKEDGKEEIKPTGPSDPEAGADPGKVENPVVDKAESGEAEDAAE